MKYEEKIARLRMIRTRNIGPVTFSILISRYGSAEAAIDALPNLTERSGIEANLTSIRDAEREILRAESLSAQIIVKGEDLYPKALLNFDDAPGCLTMLGHPHLIEKVSVAMVGSRNASANAVVFAENMAQELSQENICVVSGLARGIDTAAHRGALKGGTIAVTAGGIDHIYPKENTKLFHAIAEQGLIITEMPLGMTPTARLFPIRNRLIASISVATVVIEASLRSGSLITAKDANKRGRDVMAVPGSPLDPRSSGCNSLIKDGAILIQKTSDIIDQIRAPQFSAQAPSAIAGGIDTQPKITPDEMKLARDTITDLLSFQPTEVDELIRQCNLSASVVNIILLEMELAGDVKRSFGNRMSKVYIP